MWHLWESSGLYMIEMLSKRKLGERSRISIECRQSGLHSMQPARSTPARRSLGQLPRCERILSKCGTKAVNMPILKIDYSSPTSSWRVDKFKR